MSNDDKQCTEMYQNGLWNNVQCEEKRYAICEDVTAHKVGEFIAVSFLYVLLRTYFFTKVGEFFAVFLYLSI